LVKVYRCAVGKASTPTPNRIWRIGMKYHTDPGGIYGPRKMRLFKKVGSSFQYTAYNVHGTNQPWVIGTWASHGCIRMYNREVLELFPQVPIGTMVVTKD
jgi:lipoprotein-anchoring transpeptidase ErfK/SrfK